MENADIWLTPLILLPGVGLLIMSTAIRSGQLHSDIRQAAKDANSALSPSVLAVLIHRARLFRNALAWLYASVGLFTIASFLHGITKIAHFPLGLSVVVILSFVGMMSLIFAAVELLRESLVSIHEVESYLKT